MKKSETTTLTRESETREKQKRKTDWTPPSSLDAPPVPKGLVQRWVRVETMGFMDSANVSKALREGWEFVRADSLEKEIGPNDFAAIQEGRYKGLIGVGGHVLARIPEEIMESRKEYFEKKTKDQMTAVDSDLMKEQRPEMPINIERQSRVTFGGGSKK